MTNDGPVESALTRQDYWDDFYNNELTTFKESGHEGEEWFETDTRAVVHWITSLPGVNLKEDRILDVGCGNGLFLVRLAQCGFKHLFGCDYIPSAITLAAGVCRAALQRLLDGEDDSEDNEHGASCQVDDVRIVLSVMDVTIESEDLADRSDSNNSDERLADKSDELVLIRSPLCLGQFDIIHDKGTFDVFFMRGIPSVYVDSICRHFVKDKSIICVTSCNATEAELVECFTSSTPNRSFRLDSISKLSHRSFSFGGVTGQVVSTVAFRATKQ